ncbi:hypothetical protein F4861DRAFT_162272 [Xylaria intraflava]|nr:hypothetical protein F4861DRAFT_162272 [Xylaria intraflava]
MKSDAPFIRYQRRHHNLLPSFRPAAGGSSIRISPRITGRGEQTSPLSHRATPGMRRSVAFGGIFYLQTKNQTKTRKESGILHQTGVSVSTTCFLLLLLSLPNAATISTRQTPLLLTPFYSCCYFNHTAARRGFRPDTGHGMTNRGYGVCFFISSLFFLEKQNQRRTTCCVFCLLLFPLPAFWTCLFFPFLLFFIFGGVLFSMGRWTFRFLCCCVFS